MTASNDYKICLCYPVLTCNAVILELNSRFAGKNLDLMRSIQRCNPETHKNLVLFFVV